MYAACPGTRPVWSIPGAHPVREDRTTFAATANLAATVKKMTKAWVIRSGKFGERDHVALETSLSGGGWEELPDLTPFTTREEIAEVVEKAYPGAKKGMIIAATGQLWALRSRIKPGDLLAMPLKTTRQIALGRVTTGYQYLADNPPTMRHVVGVDWQRTDLPRNAAKQDLLHTLSSSLTIFAPSRNNSVARLESLLSSGTDPGAVEPLPVAKPSSTSVKVDPDSVDSEVDSPELTIDFEQAVSDQILTRIGETFTGHALADLIAAVLTAEGYVCDVALPGTDGGVDITAGRGPLGIDSPTVIVQVKSGDTVVGDPIVSQLQGTVHRHRADQGLLVAWGGLTKPARQQANEHRLSIAVWEADDVVDRVLANYHRLAADIHTRLPLKQVWILADNAG